MKNNSDTNKKLVRETLEGGIEAEEPKTNETKEFLDEMIDCVDCHDDFIWSEGEQQFFSDKGLKNPPKRCKPCKKAKNNRINALNSTDSRQKIEVQVDCAECDETTTVPFYLSWPPRSLS